MNREQLTQLTKDLISRKKEQLFRFAGEIATLNNTDLRPRTTCIANWEYVYQILHISISSDGIIKIIPTAFTTLPQHATIQGTFTYLTT
jgi:hypothetical protein